MSYILDALKKSERQRRLGRELFFKQAAPGSIAGPRRWVLVALILVLLLAGAIAAVWFERPEPPSLLESAAAPAPAAPMDSPPPPAAPRDISAPPVAAASVQDLAEQAHVPVAASGPARRAANKAASGDAPWLSALPEAFRRSLPPLVVNIHVYAPEEAQRILYINNRPVRRGEAVQGGVVVEDIVEDGVVLEYRGQRFKLPRPS